ncbi:MAG: glycosyltransferase family 9 protein [Gammaproteobacteria bacterium]
MAGILVIKFGALGDVVIATSAIRSIQLARPNKALWVMTGKMFANIFQDWPGVNLHAVERKGVFNTAKQLLWLRRQRFEEIVDLQSNDRSALLCALSGVAVRIGNHPRFPYTVYPPTFHGKDEPGYQRQALMLEAAGLPAPQPRPYLPLSAEQKAEVQTWLVENHLIDRPLALMHAGASPMWPAKRWPNFPALAKQITDRKIHVVWLGAGNDRSINAQFAQTVGIDATDVFSISQLAELARHARFAVTNDSGPMHVLSAAGIPVYGLFGPTDWRRCHAMGQRERALANSESCAACSRPDRATARDHTCLSGISTEYVFNRLLQDKLIE